MKDNKRRRELYWKGGEESRRDRRGGIEIRETIGAAGLFLCNAGNTSVAALIEVCRT